MFQSELESKLVGGSGRAWSEGGGVCMRFLQPQRTLCRDYSTVFCIICTVFCLLLERVGHVSHQELSDL